jgi:hypothetical protein
VEKSDWTTESPPRQTRIGPGSKTRLTGTVLFCCSRAILPDSLLLRTQIGTEATMRFGRDLLRGTRVVVHVKERASPRRQEATVILMLGWMAIVPA